MPKTTSKNNLKILISVPGILYIAISLFKILDCEVTDGITRCSLTWLQNLSSLAEGKFGFLLILFYLITLLASLALRSKFSAITSLIWIGVIFISRFFFAMAMG
jgi:hypothetical protein